ncbi:flagellar basal body-associated FliL family protein [Tepidibacter formicigenes]|jgi:flagellar FliL protein|uniref:Flagellar protein FliL n=1 Tax=Tepidibacter formicigenes DSM 15518 TaxID=1123349 RepID=A0A1M6J9W0_9FIRM|nr:flagellar basal body-associated FliL family protein [Tepidibacter formicigenes]SHJ43430.1 flagellar FliL protein [Tepidibacter formicigenes DSM 15518]
MDTKKIMIFSIIGFVLSLFIFAGTLYLTVFKSSSKEAKDIKTYNYDAGEFSTNMGDSNHYFKGNIVIETTDKKDVEKLTEKNVIVRDTVLKVIISQDPKQMTTNEGMDKIERELISKLSKSVNVKSIRNIYFTNYIVQ